MQSTRTSPSSFLTPVVLCILITETAERFSYFGFRAILVLYFTRALDYDEATAIALFAYMTCLAYLAPIVGALLADGHLGRYTTILWFGCIYTVGLAILTWGAYMKGTEDQLGMKRILTFVGLFLVCFGTGGIKPCVSAFGADQVANQRSSMDEINSENSSNGASVKEDDSTERVRAFFASFYFCINLGAVTSIFVIPIVRANYGFGAAFLTPTIFIMLAMGAFLSKRNEYVHHVPGQDGTSLATTFRLCWWLFRQRLVGISIVDRYFSCIRPTQDPLSSSEASVPDESTCELVAYGTSSHGAHVNDSDIDTGRNQQLNDAAQALHVLPIMGMLPMFWMLYDQQGSVWTLQATRMALHGWQPEQMNVVNPVLIMVFIPLFDRFIYPALQSWGFNISYLRRMGWGMLLASVAFFASGLLETIIQSREATGSDQVHVLWQLPQITILAVAEIFLSVTGLEFAYATSPDRMKAFLMALYLLTTAVGDFFGGLLYSSVFQALNRATVMHVCAVLMLGNLGLFCCVARWWERSEAPCIASMRDDGKSKKDFEYENLARTTSFKGVEMQLQHDVVIT